MGEDDRWTQVVIRTTVRMAREFDLAASLAGFSSRAAYLWHLHAARKDAVGLSDAERLALLQLASQGGFKDTPSLTILSAVLRYPEEVAAKALEGLVLRGLLRAMPPLSGPFSNDVICHGQRLRVTQQGFAVIEALGYVPRHC
jgi:hypothetical protein